MIWWSRTELKFWILNLTVPVQKFTILPDSELCLISSWIYVFLFEVHINCTIYVIDPKSRKIKYEKSAFEYINFQSFVRTEMGGPNAPLSPAESVKGVLAVLDTFQPDQSGYFYDYTGQPLSWWSTAHNSSHKTDGAMILLVLSKQIVLKDKLTFCHMSVTCHTKVTKTEANWGIP